MKTIDEISVEQKEFDLEYARYNLESEKSRVKKEEAYLERDIFQSKQEIARRGIETCISVVKLGRSATTTPAEDKIIELLKEIKVQ